MFLLTSVVLTIQAQNFNPGDLRGKYTRSTGEPGRTYQKGDGSYVSISPVTYSTTTLRLKRFGKAIIKTEGHHGMGINSQFKGNYVVSGDTLALTWNNNTERFLIDDSRGKLIYLVALRKGGIGFAKEE